MRPASWQGPRCGGGGGRWAGASPVSESGTCPEREGALRRWRATRDLWVGGRGGLQAAGQTWSWYGVSCRLRRSPDKAGGPGVREMGGCLDPLPNGPWAPSQTQRRGWGAALPGRVRLPLRGHGCLPDEGLPREGRWPSPPSRAAWQGDTARNRGFDLVQTFKSKNGERRSSYAPVRAAEECPQGAWGSSGGVRGAGRASSTLA